VRLPAPLVTALDWVNGSNEEPLRLVRLAVGALLLAGTIFALVLGLSGVEPRALELVGLFWAIYGFVVGLLSGILEPVIDGVAHLLMNVGLQRAGGGYSAIETLVARGEVAAAAEAYRERAQNPAERVESSLRRASLLAGSLNQPETAAVELENLRTAPLSDRDDLRIGLALANVHEHHLGDPGRAMTELRRLIDRHPADPAVRRLRRALEELKEERFGSLR
jgi:Tetratricopeptide repeat